jgi:multiple sugar transport system substrate-binding protein
MITSSAKNKSKAFEVLKFLVSEEIQTENSRKGIGTVLNDERIMRVMGADVEAAQGKNVQALFRNKLPPIPTISKYEGVAFIVASSFVPDLAMDEESVDEVLKKMETQINAAVAAEKAREAN